MRKLRIYADTSVFGGCYDEEYAEESNKFFEDAKAGKFILLVSATTRRELALAPLAVRKVLTGLQPHVVETAPDSPEIPRLRDAYLKSGVVGKSASRDAEHIAAATVAEADMVVSWNFKHIVHYEKIAGYNGVNLVQGYGTIQIFSPKEVVQP